MIVPRQRQSNAIDKMFNFIVSKEEGSPLTAMPTGTGKSVVIGGLNHRLLLTYPNIHIMSLTHVKELVGQNAKRQREMWPDAPLGVYSAGLGIKQIDYPLIFGGIKSVYNQLDRFTVPDVVEIDEAHLLSEEADSLYGQCISYWRERKPWMRLCGFTATPWRTGQGLLTDGPKSMFTKIVYDDTTPQAFAELIQEGALCPPVPKKTSVELDISGVSISKGDLTKGALEAAVDKPDLNYAACKEIVAYGADRRAWLIFASGIGHAEHLATIMRTFGISCKAVHSKLKGGNKERDQIIQDFKDGKLRCIVNNNVLTTGFDHPPVDLIGMLRPTVSAGLWVQMLGRGTRPSKETGKVNCLVLDFAGNTRRLGMIDLPNIPRRGEKGDGVPPTKICDTCGSYNYARAVVCSICGAEFPIAEKIEHTADHASLISTESANYEWFNVDRVIYTKHNKFNGPASLKVTYVCKESRTFHEYISFESSNNAARNIAKAWWKFRSGTSEAPPNTEEALVWAKTTLAIPKRINVWTNKPGGFHEVKTYDFRSE